MKFSTKNEFPNVDLRKHISGGKGMVLWLVLIQLQEFPKVKYNYWRADSSRSGRNLYSLHLDRVDQRELPLDNNFHPIGDGEGVDIYILDTGIFYKHEEFGNRAKFGCYDPMDEYKEENMEGLLRSWHTRGWQCCREGLWYWKWSNHIQYPYCSGSEAWGVLLAGLDYVMRIIPVRGRPAVVSISIGGSYTQSVNDAVQNLTKIGIPVVVSARNDARDACLQSPASYR